MIFSFVSLMSVVNDDDRYENEENVMTFTNEGTTDRVIRIIAGVAMLALGWGGIMSGTLGTVFKVLGFVPLLTGLVGWCPLYQLAGIKTCRVATEKTPVKVR